MPMLAILRRLLVLFVLAATALPAAAAEPAKAEPADTKDLERLVETLEDPAKRDAFIADVSSDGGTLWLLGGDPVSEEVPDFVMDVWTLDLASMAWTEVRGVE